MRYNLLLLFVFISFIALAYSGLYNHTIEILGGTELNGNGCVCHSLDRDYDVKVWIEGPDTLIKGQTGSYRMFMAGGPAEAGGYNVAGRYGTMVLVDSLSKWDDRSPNELIQAFPLVFPTSSDTIFWDFAYKVSDSTGTDTLYSVGLSIVYDTIPDSLDRWNFGPKFPVTVIDDLVPVELISFTGTYNGNAVKLNWITSSEKNNFGFEIERRPKSEESKQNSWESIGFINGNGTTTEISNYFFNDTLNHTHNHTLYYRLKQIDFDGSYKYNDIIEVGIGLPDQFVLEQNYPNPFNPVTVIRWQSSTDNWQRIRVYDVLGNEVAILADEFKPTGTYQVEFDGKDFSSGIYYYQLVIGNQSVTKKMLLLR